MTIRIGNLTGKPPLGLKGSQPKPEKRAKHGVSNAVRQSARGETCTLRLPCCCGGTETTVLAHLRLFGAGGMGHKPNDWRAVYACAACHDAIDRRNSMTAGLWGFEDLLRALMETHDRLAAKGLLRIG